jgi:hypothetical protein
MKTHAETTLCVLVKIMRQNVFVRQDIEETHTSAVIKMLDVKQTVSVPII